MEIKDFVKASKNKKIGHVYDIELQHIDKLKRFDSVECHIVLYPYSRKFKANDMIFYPFEEYARDISSCKNSAYSRIGSSFNKIFAVIMGLIILLLFVIFRPEELLSMQSIVSVFGAYIIAKELGNDLEKWIIRITKPLKFRYQESYYSYELEKHNALTKYSHYAKKQRYDKTSIRPTKMEFIELSNSKTVRMYFDTKDLKNNGNSIHILSVWADPELLKEFDKGFMLGVKLSLNKGKIFKRSLELFQSVSKGVNGCIGPSDSWFKDSVYFRRIKRFMKIRFLRKRGYLRNKKIVELVK